MVFFCIVLLTLAMLEFWKKKETDIALEWGMSNFERCELYRHTPTLSRATSVEHRIFAIHLGHSLAPEYDTMSSLCANKRWFTVAVIGHAQGSSPVVPPAPPPPPHTLYPGAPNENKT